MAIINRIAEFHKEMIEWRHDIHSNPELAYQEKRTSKKVASLLKDFGVDKIVEGIGGTGVVGIIKNGEGKKIALRADMDALPIEEANKCNHVSNNKGVMHACGHDGHTAMLLGAAKYLSETRKFKGEVILVFQPAEEGFAGAKAMIKDGLFEKSDTGKLLDSLIKTMRADEHLLKSLKEKKSSGKIKDIAKISFQIKRLEEKISDEREKLSYVRRHQK